MKGIDKLKDIIKNSRSIVVFSGAGLSTNSGIPDFRSAAGLYQQKLNYRVPPEEIISHSFFMSYPEDFYRFYFDKMIYPDAKPNSAHLYFAELEKQGKSITVITQNIDNLHQEAGSRHVIELHGSVKRNYCMKCHRFYSLDEIYKAEVPYCACGGRIKPDVVLYEESLREEDVNAAVSAISRCDALLVVGTSLTVYPAAGFIRYYHGNRLVLLNKSETPYDAMANLAIHEDIKNIVEELTK